MSKLLRPLAVFALALLLVGGGVGCTRRNQLMTGSVTVAGQPVKAGRITFTLPTRGHRYTAAVTNGRYTVPGRRKTPGTYTVTVEYSSTGTGTFDRTHTEQVDLYGSRTDHTDFRLK